MSEDTSRKFVADTLAEAFRDKYPLLYKATLPIMEDRAMVYVKTLPVALLHGLNWRESPYRADFWSCVYLISNKDWNGDARFRAINLGLPSSKPESFDMMEYALLSVQGRPCEGLTRDWYKPFLKDFASSRSYPQPRRRIILPTKKPTTKA